MNHKNIRIGESYLCSDGIVRKVKDIIGHGNARRVRVDKPFLVPSFRHVGHTIQVVTVRAKPFASLAQRMPAGPSRRFSDAI